jgi:hypothetical protein
VRVSYVTAANAMLTVTLFDANHDIRGSGTVSVKRGSGLLDVNVTPSPGNPAGAYTLQGKLTNPSLLAQTPELPIQIAAVPAINSASLAIEPSVVPIGEVFRITVGYATNTARDLRLELSNPSGALIATAVQPVAAGSRTIDMTISYPLASAGAHTARVFVVPTGGNSSQAIASSSIETLQIVSRAYSQWTFSRWGVILASDPISPQLDPDGDGSMNTNEYVALTDPRNPASILRPNITRNSSQVTVSWPSNIGRNYQLFSRPNLASGQWSAVNLLQAGTGGTMSYSASLSTAGTLNFYRVQLSVP